MILANITKTRVITFFINKINSARFSFYLSSLSLISVIFFRQKKVLDEHMNLILSDVYLRWLSNTNLLIPPGRLYISNDTTIIVMQKHRCEQDCYMVVMKNHNIQTKRLEIFFSFWNGVNWQYSLAPKKIVIDLLHLY